MENEKPMTKSYLADLIYKVNYKNEEIYIVLLIEFQSTINKFMPLRKLHYITSFHLKYLKQNEWSFSPD